jgi:hypothetical protein
MQLQRSFVVDFEVNTQGMVVGLVEVHGAVGEFLDYGGVLVIVRCGVVEV